MLLYVEQANAYGVAPCSSPCSWSAAPGPPRRTPSGPLLEQAEVSELEKARRAVLEERTRIAREMHDVVAHHMSMIAVQAETAPFRLTDLPPARDEFVAIAAPARAALADIRAAAERSPPATTTSADTAPQPGLGTLPDLVEGARGSASR